jgi:hypothetical protein
MRGSPNALHGVRDQQLDGPRCELADTRPPTTLNFLTNPGMAEQQQSRPSHNLISPSPRWRTTYLFASLPIIKAWRSAGTLVSIRSIFYNEHHEDLLEISSCFVLCILEHVSSIAWLSNFVVMQLFAL